MRKSRAGGILFGALITFGAFVLFVVLVIGYLVRNVRVEHSQRSGGARTRIETPMGTLAVDARDNLDPEVVGVPVYPGAERTHDSSGGALVDLDNGGRHKQFSIAAASFTTTDSPSQVREFYHARLPHWIFTNKHGEDCSIEFSREGYKRIVAIDERDGRTHIGIVSLGKSGVN